MLAKIIFDRDELDADYLFDVSCYNCNTCKDVMYIPPNRCLLMRLLVLLVGTIAPLIGAIPTLTFRIAARNTGHQEVTSPTSRVSPALLLPHASVFELFFLLPRRYGYIRRCTSSITTIITLDRRRELRAMYYHRRRRYCTYDVHILRATLSC